MVGGYRLDWTVKKMWLVLGECCGGPGGARGMQGSPKEGSRTRVGARP